MKKNKWIVYLLVALIAIVIISPPMLGWMLKKQYQKNIDFYNSFDPIKIEIKSYQNGWWSSNATLIVHVNAKNFKGDLNLPAKFDFVIDQIIKHGPLLYHRHSGFPISVGLSETQSSFAISMDEHLLSIIRAVSDGHQKEAKNQLTIKREMTIEQLKLDKEVFGPLDVIFTAKQLNATVISDIFAAYSEFFHEGEVYQGQLRGKLLLLIPQIFNPGATLSIDSLSIETPYGPMHASGKIVWPADSASTPDDVEDFLHNAPISFSLRASQALVDEFIRYISTLPYTQDFTQEQRNQLLASQNDINTAFQQNNVLLGELMYLRILSETAGSQLLLLARDDSLADRYLANIKTLFLNKAITPETAYLLYWQFGQLQRQVDVFEQQLDQHQDIAKKNLFLWLQDWVKQGYISRDKNDYVIEMRRADGVVKLNGKVLKDQD